IYASLKPVRQWYNNFVPPVLLVLSLASGAASLAAMTTFWAFPDARIAGALSVALCLIAMAAKLAYWRHIDTTRPGSTIETATGLGALGPVREFERPNTEEN